MVRVFEYAVHSHETTAMILWIYRPTLASHHPPPSANIATADSNPKGLAICMAGSPAHGVNHQDNTTNIASNMHPICMWRAFLMPLTWIQAKDASKTLVSCIEQCFLFVLAVESPIPSPFRRPNQPCYSRYDLQVCRCGDARAELTSNHLRNHVD